MIQSSVAILYTEYCDLRIAIPRHRLPSLAGLPPRHSAAAMQSQHQYGEEAVTRFILTTEIDVTPPLFRPEAFGLEAR